MISRDSTTKPPAGALWAVFADGIYFGYVAGPEDSAKAVCEDLRHRVPGKRFCYRSVKAWQIEARAFGAIE